MTQRPSWDEYCMQLARLAATRATCPRKNVGAIVLDKNNRVVGTGYNGAPKGLPHCTDIGCLMIDGHCCRTIHAEQNAVLQAGTKADGGTLYCTLMPCPLCIKIAVQQGIKRVVFQEAYNQDYVRHFINNMGIDDEIFEKVQH